MIQLVFVQFSWKNAIGFPNCKMAPLSCKSFALAHVSKSKDESGHASKLFWAMIVLMPPCAFSCSGPHANFALPANDVSGSIVWALFYHTFLWKLTPPRNLRRCCWFWGLATLSNASTFFGSSSNPSLGKTKPKQCNLFGAHEHFLAFACIPVPFIGAILPRRLSYFLRRFHDRWSHSHQHALWRLSCLKISVLKCVVKRQLPLLFP